MRTYTVTTELPKTEQRESPGWKSDLESTTYWELENTSLISLLCTCNTSEEKELQADLPHHSGVTLKYAKAAFPTS